jgi:uncharacterized membrane protein
MIKQKSYLHYLSLVGIIVLGAILRFTNLDLKPLWMDEVITTIFSLGKNYKDLPLNTIFPLTKLIEIFTYQPGLTCPQIAANIASQSTHPPLFFCTMYDWLGWLQPLGENWIWKMRSLPSIFGVAAIFVIYWVNRIAFSPQAGIAAAACMAVSPFAVYLSQEARHYTLPMLLVSLAILGLIQIQQDIFLENPSRKKRLWVWCYWIIVNSVSLYVHYFCILAVIAQVATLVSLLIWRKPKIPTWKQSWVMLILSTSAIAFSFLPWLLVMLNHSKRSETDWLQPPQHIAPVAQTIINWLLMVIAFPVEKQPLPIGIISGFFMLLFGIWLARKVAKGLKTLLLSPESQLPTLTLLSFSIWIILEFFAIIYLLGKDITVVPRYNFIYYPSFCALLGASLGGSRGEKEGGRRRGGEVMRQNTCSISSISPSPLSITLFVGTISCIFLLCNLVFQKPFQPELVSKNFNQESSTPTIVVVGYSDYQDVALGLSFALAFERLRSLNQTKEKTTLNLPVPEFAFFDKKPNFSNVLQNISQLNPPTPRLNLWIVASGLRKRDFPQKVFLKTQSICSRDDKQYYRIGIPYQLYRCGI